MLLLACNLVCIARIYRQKNLDLKNQFKIGHIIRVVGIQRCIWGGLRKNELIKVRIEIFEFIKYKTS